MSEQELKYVTFEGVKGEKWNKYDLSITNKRCIFIHLSSPLTFWGVFFGLLVALNALTIMLIGYVIFGGVILTIILYFVTARIMQSFERGKRNKVVGQSLDAVLPLNSKNFTIDNSEITKVTMGKNGKSFMIGTNARKCNVEVALKDASKISLLKTIPNFKEKIQ